ncbi:MAG: hypothetical protein JSS82_15450 [Bacteroidetes bacterium]|nr:hypothetical protein [Bacteroidota bacterium]
MNKEEIAKEIKTCEDRLSELRKKLEEPEFKPLRPDVYLCKWVKAGRFDRIIVAGTEQTYVYDFAGKQMNEDNFVTNGNAVKLSSGSAIEVYFDLTALTARK